LVGLGVFLVLVLVGAAAAVMLSGGDDDPNADEGDQTEDTQPDTTDPTTDGTDPDQTTTTAVDLAADCDRSRQVCITSIRYEDGTDPIDGSEVTDGLVAEYETDLVLSLPADHPSVHAHFYLSPAVSAENSGTNGPLPGSWNIWATTGEYSPFAEADSDGEGITRADVGDNTELCVTVANESHQVLDPTTAHCVPLPA
jgi:hypothetical protein